MATLRERLQAILRDEEELVQLTVDDLKQELSERLGAFADSLRDILGEDLTLDIVEELLEKKVGPRLADDVRAEFQVEAEENAGDDVAGWLYIGPDDSLTRPFCDVLAGTWLTREEINQLDNQQLGDAFAFRGGYNCRHHWTVLNSGMVGEFPHGDASAANAAASDDRKAA